MSLLLVFSRHRSRPSRRAGHAAAAQRISGCSLLTPDITAKYLDARIAKYLTPDEEPVGVVGTRCEYGRIGLQVDPVGAGPSRTTFGPDWQPQPGLGQAAFHRPNRTQSAELYVSKGPRR